MLNKALAQQWGLSEILVNCMVASQAGNYDLSKMHLLNKILGVANGVVA